MPIEYANCQIEESSNQATGQSQAIWQKLLYKPKPYHRLGSNVYYLIMHHKDSKQSEKERVPQTTNLQARGTCLEHLVVCWASEDGAPVAITKWALPPITVQVWVNLGTILLS